MLYVFLVCYFFIKFLVFFCLFEVIGRLCKGCLVRDISFVGRGVIVS